MKPVLLLIPGMLNTEAIWDDVAALLADAAEVRVAKVQTQASIAEMAQDAWAQLADVPVQQPIVVCGFSMGGYVTLEMIANPARRTSAIGLLDTSARSETPDGTALREKTIAAIGRDFAKVVDGVLQFGTHAGTQAQPALMARLRELMLAVESDTAVRQNRAIMARTDYRAQLSNWGEVPTLVMCGREDRITPPALSEELAQLIPGARLEWIDDAGHMTPLEQPQRVAALLRSLL